jgi:prevent-host-death family protein
MYRPSDGPGPTLQVSEDIVPIGEFKAHLSEKIRGVRTSGRPLVITQNGKAAAVLLSPEEFDRMTSEARFVMSVREGLADAEAGRVVSEDELDRRIDERFKRRRKAE